jgi:hypothetical protein
MSRRIDWIFGILGLALLAACDAPISSPGDAEATGAYATPAVAIEAPCVPCVVAVDGWHATPALDYWVRPDAGTLTGRATGDVCRATLWGAPMAGSWTVADAGELSGHPVLVRSDSPQTCETAK